MSMRRMRLFLILFCLVPAGMAPAAQIDPDNPPQGVFSEEWMVALLGGKRAGYVHTTMSREADKVTTRTVSVLSLARGGATVEVSMMQSATETVAGLPLDFAESVKMATMTTETRGTISDGEVQIAKTQFGMTQNLKFPYPKDAVMYWGLYAEQLRQGLQEGHTYQVQAYTPSLLPDKALPTTVVVGGRETVDVLGKPVQARRTNVTMSSPMGSLETVSWVTEEGVPLKTQIQMMGLVIEMVRADKETATQDVDPPEMFFNTLVQADKRIDRKAAQRIRYRLRVVGEGEPIPTLPVTGMQQPTPHSDEMLELTVARQDHRALSTAALGPPTEEMAEYLEANIWINSDDPMVITMAKKAAGDARTPYEIADRLREFVSEVIKEKNLSVGFASASEVCRNKEGDCSEHGVLLAALGRVHKIPSRVVLGLVYVPWFGGTEDVFGFHMWTQFYLGDQWVDFDAAQHESDCNPTHIAVATSSLQNSSLADMAFGLIALIGRLEIDVLEAEPAAAATVRQSSRQRAKKR